MGNGIVLDRKPENLVKTPEEVDGEVRARNCLIDIQKILKRWNCRINPVVNISAMGGISCGFDVIPMKNTVGS